MSVDKLLDECEKNNGKASIFSNVIPFEWYDGALTGIAKLIDTESWYIFNLALFDTTKDYRIFTLIETSQEWVTKLEDLKQLDRFGTAINYDEIKNMFKKAFLEYNGNAYMFKANHFEDHSYHVVKVSKNAIKYFNDIEETFAQSEKSKEKIKSFFEDFN